MPSRSEKSVLAVLLVSFVTFSLLVEVFYTRQYIQYFIDDVSARDIRKALVCSVECQNNQCEPGSFPKIPMAYIIGNIVIKNANYNTYNWGNVLSPHWAARSMAYLGGYKFKGRPFSNETWMKYLPQEADAVEPQKELFDKTCGNCRKFVFFHEGTCSYGWGHMSNVIFNDTRYAIMEYSKHDATPKENEEIFNFFGPNDWVIYHRCGIFHNSNHAPGVLRVFDVIPSEGEFNVYIMIGRPEDRFNFCPIFINESIDRMKSRNENINVTILDQSTLFVDFARLVFAPNVLLPSTGSSWTLWSAMFANNNTVVSVLPMIGTDLDSLKDLPDNVKILGDIPIIRVPEVFPEAAEEMGIPAEEFSNSTEHRKKVIDYYRNA